jgi:hypothetical protein
MSSHVGIGVVGYFSFEKEVVAEELRKVSVHADPILPVESFYHFMLVNILCTYV